MDKDILDGLKNFDEVWKRVQSSKTAEASKAPSAKLMPRKGKNRCNSRFIPPR